MIRDDLPGKPFIQVFSIEGKLFTSVVLDSDEFDRLLDEVARQPLGGLSEAAWAEQVSALRKLRNITAIGRGTKTQWLFDRFDVKTDTMGVMVRGQGMNVARKLGLA